MKNVSRGNWFRGRFRVALSGRGRLGVAAASLAALAIACSGSGDSQGGGYGAQSIQPSATAAAAEAGQTPTLVPSATSVPPTLAPSPVPASATPQQAAATATSVATSAPTSVPQPPAALTLNVSAMNIAFDRASISVPVETQVTVVFTNNDASVLHDFGVSIPPVSRTQTCSGPCNDSITFDSGPAGTYSFNCSIHPSMVGTFSVQ